MTSVENKPKKKMPVWAIITIIIAVLAIGGVSAYAAIINSPSYKVKKKLELADHFYEDVIWDDLSVRNYENYLIKLSIQVL